MGKQPVTDFFDPEVQRIIREDGCTVYQMENVTGKGVITRYEILPGIEIFYNDFHMTDGQNQNKLPYADVLEINHCREGRFISITIDLGKASDTIRRLENVMGELRIDVFDLADKFCGKNTCLALRNFHKADHIFSELYCINPEKFASYLKIKVLELLMELSTVDLQNNQKQERYFSGKQVQTIKSIHKYMTEDLKQHHTLQQLSEQFKIPLTSMKNCFKAVYGCSIYAYMRSYRMQAATVLLRDTDESITDIATKMGYDNPSKFTEVFKKECGELPSEFRKNKL